MVSTGNEGGSGSNLSHSGDCETLNGANNSRNHVSLQVSTSRKGLLSDEKSPRGFDENPTSLSSRLKLLKVSPKGKRGSPSAGFLRISEDKDEFSSNAPVMQGLRKRFKDVMSSKVDWPSVRRMCKEWIKRPLNMVLLLWIVCVAVSGAILFLVMTGMLNHVLPKKSQRDEWFEVNNQIINALFTLMCLYQHPKRFYHLVLLCRWKSDDISVLRKTYCKNGTAKPNEWAHMMVVITLLHINCFAQYALCGLNLGYRRSERPLIGVGVCITFAIAAPAVTGLYCVLSPLGKDYECDADEEAPKQLRRQSLEKRFAFATRDERGIVENKPEWKGGFGNMYVNIATFLLFCTAPFWIFNLAAANIDNETVRGILGITGIALCVFGLLYGGFWRIQMRKRFNLPPNNMCFGKPNVADCVQWLFCCWCSLAQEVRTADFYETVEDRIYNKNGFDSHSTLTPLPREGSTDRSGAQSTSDLNTSFWLNSGLSKIEPSVLMNETMMPPNPATMRMEVEDLREV
uniref:PLAC8 family protein n=1 Tax=Chenopodium quinoa TaxID=63459 RepID=A0A803L378_CHEQI